MTTPTTELLTDDELDALDTFVLAHMAPRGKDSVRAYGRAIERALLARLGEQQPVAWRVRYLGHKWSYVEDFQFAQATATKGGWEVESLFGKPTPAASTQQATPSPAPVGAQEREALAVARAAKTVSDWMAGGCAGEPPRPQLAVLHTLCGEMAAGALAARSAAQGAVQVPAQTQALWDACAKAAEAERQACAIAVWMVKMDAAEPDADDLGVAGWLEEAEARIKRRGEKAAMLAATRSAAQGAVQVPAWKPIETAPRDGTDILLSNGVTVAEGHWLHEEPYIRERRDLEGRYIDQDESDGCDGWMDWSGGMQPEPTHWQPLPAAPAHAGERSDERNA